MKIKKILIGMPVLVAPVAAVISCGSESKKTKTETKKTAIETTNLNGESFELTTDSGSIKLKDDVTLPEQVEAKYYKGSKTELKDSDYSTTIPTKLKDGDVIKIKFFIKSANTGTHKFSENFMNMVTVQVDGGNLKTWIDISNFNTKLFMLSGHEGAGKITLPLQNEIFLAKQVEVKYYVGATASKNLSDYTATATNLSNNAVVHIKLFIKAKYANTHMWPAGFTTNTLKYTVKGLKALVTTGNLNRSAFQVGGSTEGSKRMLRKSSPTFPSQVEFKYYKGSESEVADSDYDDSLNDLSNGDVVKIKFFIRKEDADTHKFPEDFMNVITIKVDNTADDGFKVVVDTSLLVSKSFVTNASGAMDIKSGIDLPFGVEAKYYKGTKTSLQDSDFQTSLTGLDNGDDIKIRFFIKSANTATHMFPDGFEETIDHSVTKLS